MTLTKLAFSLVLLFGILIAASWWRAAPREAKALENQPPEGRFVTVEGVQLHYVTAGSGPDLVLIHGASGSLRDFTFDLMPRLAQDFRVIAFDRPGLGHSDAAPGEDITLATQGRLLRAAAAVLGARQPIVLGHSYGGAVALAWALEAPPAALVLVAAPSLPWPGALDPWYRLNGIAPARWAVLHLAAAWVPESYVRRAFRAVFAPDAMPAGYDDHMGVAMALRRKVLDVNVRQVNALRAQLVQMEPRYAGLTLPIEMVHGDADTVVPLAIHSGPLAPRLPSARLTVLPGAGHMPHHGHPQVVIDAVRRAATRAGLR